MKNSCLKVKFEGKVEKIWGKKKEEILLVLKSIFNLDGILKTLINYATRKHPLTNSFVPRIK